MRGKLIKQKDDIQRIALVAWVDSGRRGSVEIVTGLGKTFIGLHALYTMPRNDDIHLFLAETVSREADLEADIIKYNEIFGRDVHRDYNLYFKCYQTVYKWEKKEFGLIIADEIHDSLTPAYARFYFHNKFKAIIGLSATINRKIAYEHNATVVTKGEILDRVAPVCFTYTISQAQQENTLRKLNVYVIRHKLDSINKTVQSGNKTKQFFQTETSAYEYWDKQHKSAWFIDDAEKRDLKIRISSSKRSAILYNLHSKLKIVQRLLPHIEGKSIVFGNSIDSLLKITRNVVSSRNSDWVNEKIRKDFDNGWIKVIGSFKKLKQGANLVGLDNCILMSYYSTDKDFIQRIGRLRQNGEIGRVFIILTMDTQEEVWFAKMTENIKNLNIVYCDSVDACIIKQREND